MRPSPGRYRLELLGPFRLVGPDGARVEITSRRGMALLAMLAMSRDGERTRAWLQERLWGSRPDVQAQGSLRTELSDLRRRLAAGEPPLLSAGHERVRLDLSQIEIDARGAPSGAPDSPTSLAGEFLEGLDLPGEEGFAEWVAEQRQTFAHAVARVGPRSDLAARTLATAPGARPRPDLATPPSRLLAVLAFENLSNDPEMDYFSDGVSEDIQVSVCRIRHLDVVGRASSFQLRGPSRKPEAVAAALGATHLLEGSVRRSGSRVRITASLVDCASRATLWSERFDRELAEVFEVQDEIARAVASALAIVFSPAIPAPRIDPHAYDAYLRARALAGHPDENKQCLALLETAVRHSPDFAPAWASLAMTRAIQLTHELRDAGPGEREQARRGVLEAAERATELDPSLGLPFVALGHLEPPAAYARQEARLEQARRASPDDLEVLKHSADFAGNVGRMRENLDLVSRAHRADPLNRTSAMNYCVALADVGFLDESYDAFEAAQARWPDSDNLVAVPVLHAALLGDSRRLEKFSAVARRFVATRGETRPIRIVLATAELMQAPRAVARAHVLGMAERALARTGSVELRTPLFAYQLGLHDEAFEMIARCDYRHLFEPGGRRADYTFLTSIIFGATNADIRRDPRFVDLCARLGLCDYWLESGRWPDCADKVDGLYDFRTRAAALARANA